MSMELMVKAMKIKVGNPLRKLVLLKLADNASDLGECWPSYQHIADQCEISRQSVMRHIKTLANDGLLRIEERKTKGGLLNQSNVYFLTLNAKKSGNTESLGGSDTESLGSNTESLGSNTESLGGSNTESPRISHSLEPVNEPIKNIKKGFDLSALSQLPSDEVWQDFLTHRKNIKAKLTQSAVNLLIGELNKAVTAGFTTDYALSYVMAQGWRGFKYEWMQNKGVQAQTPNPEHWNSKQSWDDFL